MYDYGKWVSNKILQNMPKYENDAKQLQQYIWTQISDRNTENHDYVLLKDWIITQLIKSLLFMQHSIWNDYALVTARINLFQHSQTG